MDDDTPRDPAGPPEDPESWTDDQWISWLEATDEPDASAGPSRPRRGRRGSPAGLLGTAMVGLHELIYGRHDDEIAIVADAGGEPPGDDLPDVHLDPEHPERSEVVVRRRHGGADPPPRQSSDERGGTTN
jgi:hypothetical protein